MYRIEVFAGGEPEMDAAEFACCCSCHELPPLGCCLARQCCCRGRLAALHSLEVVVCQRLRLKICIISKLLDLVTAIVCERLCSKIGCLVCVVAASRILFRLSRASKREGHAWWACVVARGAKNVPATIVVCLEVGHLATGLSSRERGRRDCRRHRTRAGNANANADATAVL